MEALGVTEWDNLGYRDSDMMGRPGNRDPRTFWQADIDEAIGRMVWMVRRFRPDVMTTYNDFGGYGHPDHIRTHVVAVGAFARAGDPAWYPEQLAPEHGGTGAPEAEGGLAPWTPAKLYEQAIPRVGAHWRSRSGWRTIGERSFWMPAGGRHARAARRVRGVRCQDARPRRDDHRLGGRQRRARRPLGAPSRPTSPRSATRTRSCGSVATPGGTSGRRRRSCARRRECRPRPGDGPVRGTRRPGARPLRLGLTGFPRRRAAGGRRGRIAPGPRIAPEPRAHRPGHDARGSHGRGLRLRLGALRFRPRRSYATRRPILLPRPVGPAGASFRDAPAGRSFLP